MIDDFDQIKESEIEDENSGNGVHRSIRNSLIIRTKSKVEGES